MRKELSRCKELADYIMEQLSDLGEVQNIPMMGGYIFIIKNGYWAVFMEVVLW